MFIMTVRHRARGRQIKLTVERGVCYVREYMLYPYSNIMVCEHRISRAYLMAVVGMNLATHAAGTAGSNVYFNGKNYKKFVDKM